MVTKVDKLVMEGDNGIAILVNGKVVAWFAEFDDVARDWCSYSYPGEWIGWTAAPPPLIPMTEEEYERAVQEAKKLLGELTEG